jgi:hypothetical protein
MSRVHNAIDHNAGGACDVRCRRNWQRLQSILGSTLISGDGVWTEYNATTGVLGHIASGTTSATLSMLSGTATTSTLTLQFAPLLQDARRHIIGVGTNTTTLTFTPGTIPPGFGEPAVHARYHYGPSTATAVLDILLDDTRDWRHYNIYAQVRAASTIDRLQHYDRLSGNGIIKAGSDAIQVVLHDESGDGGDYIQGQLIVLSGTNNGKLILRLTPHPSLTGTLEGYVDAVAIALSEVSADSDDYEDVP